MKLEFIGADHEVTGSCHYIEVGDKHILVDYGMEQGVNTFENVPLPVADVSYTCPCGPFGTASSAVCKGFPRKGICHGGDGAA